MRARAGFIRLFGYFAPSALLALLLLPLGCPSGDRNGPGNGEICGDDRDNDGDGDIDEGADEDGDSFRDCDAIAELIDCDDSNAAVHPEADEICDGVDNDCNGVLDDVDLDGDGHVSVDCGGADCDDSRPDVNPDALESCDFTDNDCDGEFDEGFDADDDGWTRPCGGDCDNTDPYINPDAEEVCDGVDNDCDCPEGDAGDSNGDGVRCSVGDEGVDEAFDADGDGYVDESDPFCADVYGDSGPGAAWGDCDDSDPELRPLATELTDGIDNDCDGCLDECQDYDGDGWDGCDIGDDGDPTCPADFLSDDGLDADCVDNDSFISAYIHPDFQHTTTDQDGNPVTLDEICDQYDNDCDGVIDEGYDPATCYPN